MVACGQPLSGHEIRIVDDAGRELAERREGRLEFRGPSATRGYYRNDAKTHELIHDGWVDSGDRAYVVGGDVYVTGRIKDIIIRAGQHLYPHEIEQAVASIAGVRKGGVAVFGISDRTSGTERVIVLAETRETDAEARAKLQAQAHEVMTAMAGTPPDEVVLAPPGTVPKTSSGKIRRSAARELYESGSVVRKRRSVTWQILRLAVSGIGPQLRRGARSAGELVYASWWWFVLSIGSLTGYLAVLMFPRLEWRWSALRLIGRGALRLMGITLSVKGLDRIPRQGAMLVFNHSSYMDVLVLAAVLPGEPAIVAKKELSDHFPAGLMLRRLGTPFVERYDVSGGLADAQALIDVAKHGRNLVFFPEGTFTRRAGLSEFYLGAFKVATDALLPILPGVIRGTRAMLRSDQWFPRRSAVSVEIGEPVMPSGKDFQSVLKLRDTVRTMILSRCGEPNLGELVKPERPQSAD
jgi:1-acyl-sn-glycerol-3-phosphate acyltransferase